MARKLILDTSSIMSFVKYYCFNKQKEKKIYDKLETFILSRIKNEEIIIIDKVLKELRNPESNKLKDKMKSFGYSTQHLLDKIEPLFEANLVQIRLKYLDEWELESQRGLYSDKYADLYLIAVCEEFIKQDHQVILISEESLSNDHKLVEKLPTICNRRDIEYRNLPYMIFIVYKNELSFDLEIKK